MFRAVIDIFLPLLLHLLCSDAASLVLGARFDAAFVSAAAAIAVLPFLAVMYRRDQKKDDQPRQKVSAWVYLLAAGCGAAMNLLFSWLLKLFSVTETFSNAAQEGLLASGFATQLVGLCVIVPIVEELLFRGLIYRRMKKYFPVWAAVLLNTVLFALYHGNMVQILFAIPMGLAIALFYEKWDSLDVPIIFHAASNLTTVLLQSVL